jgi:hypothetical protein
MIAGLIDSTIPPPPPTRFSPVFNQFSISFQPAFTMENQLFERIAGLQIIICRQCQYGVPPVDIPRHLKQ